MDRGTIRNMQSFVLKINSKNKFEKLVHPVGFITRDRNISHWSKKNVLAISRFVLSPADFRVDYEGPIWVNRICQRMSIEKFYSERSRVLRIGGNTIGRGNRGIPCATCWHCKHTLRDVGLRRSFQDWKAVYNCTLYTEWFEIIFLASLK